MNDAFQAASGLEPDVFPAATPTYLGHYHVPHVVAKNGQPTNIQYVGSPYQGAVPLAVFEAAAAATCTSAQLLLLLLWPLLRLDCSLRHVRSVVAGFSRSL